MTFDAIREAVRRAVLALVAVAAAVMLADLALRVDDLEWQVRALAPRRRPALVIDHREDD